MSNLTNERAFVSQDSISKYLRDIKSYDMLTAEEEYEYAVKYKETKSSYYAEKLIKAHLRLVVSIANKYRNPNISFSEIVSEGNVGLIKSVKKFKPESGNRLSTYASHWIKSSINEFIMRSWSMVKIGTTVAQKKLFFNLRRELEILGVSDTNVSDDNVNTIAEKLSIKPLEVRSMIIRLLRSDFSLDARKAGQDSDRTAIDDLSDPDSTLEENMIEQNDISFKRGIFKNAFSTLNEREQIIISRRRLANPCDTLDVLAIRFGISKERVRQIELNAFSKLSKIANANYKKLNLVSQLDAEIK